MNMYKKTSITLDYQVDFRNKLGSGLHGVVFECKNKISKKKYAVKLVYDTENNRQEVELQSKFQSSDNVVRIVDVYENTFRMGKSNPLAKCLFIVMDLMKSGDLYSLIENYCVFTESQAAHIFKQIACGLFDLHKDGIVHGDIKPENILLNTQDSQSESNTLTQYQYKLADFGSSFVEREGSSELSFTPFYAPPEVLLKDTTWNKTPSPNQKTTQSSKSDVWSLGSVLYLLLTGSVPFVTDPTSSDMTYEIFNSTTKGDYCREGENWQQLSPKAKDLFHRIFKVDPAERLSLDEVLVHPWVLQF
ncbi:MAP kinase-activated protein kinase 5 isoform X2 [Oopsacas minuta]|uniref:non-specific serine/threonine protein kinase n=1 Tax=Oopsacas minuta TaxID=111878 RepID=A0AAV7K5B0_9METZ|nr:MAP kinase-activated protein kinase 5 isoform X2 [Oopsacas minuta]